MSTNNRIYSMKMSRLQRYYITLVDVVALPESNHLRIVAAGSCYPPTIVCHVTCALIEASPKLAAYKQPGNEGSCQYELVESAGVSTSWWMQSESAGVSTKI